MNTFQLWRYHDWMVRITQSPKLVINENLSKEKKKVFLSPNPFFKELNIRFLLSSPGNLIIKIYDIKGNLVDKIIKSDLKSGEYNFKWRKNLSPGVYIIDISSKSFQHKEKIIYLR